MTAGRFFLTSSPMEGSKFTHQTSRRFMRYVLEGRLSPLHSLLLPLVVLRHFGIGRFEIGTNHVGADQFLNESTYLSGPYSLAESLVNLFINGDGQFLLHSKPPYTCTIRVNRRHVKSKTTFNQSRKLFRTYVALSFHSVSPYIFSITLVV